MDNMASEAARVVPQSERGAAEPGLGGGSVTTPSSPLSVGLPMPHWSDRVGSALPHRAAPARPRSRDPPGHHPLPRSPLREADAKRLVPARTALRRAIWGSQAPALAGALLMMLPALPQVRRQGCALPASGRP